MTSPLLIRVLIADDHHIIRDGLKVFLANQPDIKVVGEASNGRQALELSRELKPDIILMDLVMPVIDGTSAIKLVRKQDAQVRILALTSFTEKSLVQEAVQAGANGFLYKDCTPEELVSAIRNLSSGQPALSSLATQALMDSMAKPATPVPDLTKREIEVLTLVAKGATNTEIARQISLSTSTVGFHISNIFIKLGAGNRTEAANLGRKYRLILPE